MLRLSLKKKLLGIGLVFAFIIVMVGGWGYWSLNSVSNEYHFVVDKVFPKNNLINNMYLEFRQIRISLRTLGLVGVSSEVADGAIKDLMKAVSSYEQYASEYLALGLSPDQEEIYKELNSAWLAFKQLGEESVSLYKSNNPADRQRLQSIFFVDCVEKAQAYNKAVDKLKAFHMKMAKTGVESAIETESAAMTYSAFMSLVGILIGLSLSVLFSSKISQTLAKISGRILSASEDTASGGQQLYQASSQLSSSSTEAAASLEETVASLEQLSSMVKMNTSHAEEANSLSQRSRETALRGETEMEKLITAMSEIASGSKKIEEIINVIDDIAFQTNLLALNAAVEAARAGEQGKGFAVVAEAVRTLAQRSSLAAKDISLLIRDNVEKSENGAKVAEGSSEVFKEILISVKKVADLNQEISTGSREQSAGIEQISKAMNQLDQATQGNAASSEEVSASAEQMSKQAHILVTTAAELKAIITGAEVVGQAKEVEQHVISKKNKRPYAKSNSNDVIPFGDENVGKIGSLEGF